MKTVIFTSDNHSWLLKGFLHQWSKYGLAELKLEVAGFTNPGSLPPDVGFVSIGDFKDYPVESWSDAIIKYLNSIDDEMFLFMLEDYWLIRPINREALMLAYEFMVDRPDIARFDVASDRMFNRGAQYVGSFKTLDICQAKGDYSLSFQASIYRRDALLAVLRPSETPWQSELKGSYRLNSLDYKVVGSYQWPINYMILMNKGKIDKTGGWMFPARSLKMEDWTELAALGYLQPAEAVQP